MARRMRPLLAHVGSLLDPKPPVRSMFGRTEPEAIAEDPVRHDTPKASGDRNADGVEP